MSTATEQSRRRRVVYHALHPHLPSPAVRAAVRLCDTEFAADRAFSLTRFLNRLGELDRTIGQPLRYFEHLQRLNRLSADAIGPDPNDAPVPPAGHRPQPRSAGGWSAVAAALLDEIGRLVVTTHPRLAAEWQDRPHAVPANGTKEQLHRTIHDVYVWLCEELGPVVTDKLFRRAVAAVGARPEAAEHPPQGLL